MISTWAIFSYLWGLFFPLIFIEGAFSSWGRGKGEGHFPKKGGQSILGSRGSRRPAPPMPLIHVIGLIFQCPNLPDLMGSDVDGLYGWMWILWLLSFMWIGGHIWRPKSRRLASTEQMFGTPYYSGLLIDTSMIFNRRSDKGACDFRLDFHSDSSPASPPMSQHNSLKHAEVGGLTLPNGTRPTYNRYSLYKAGQH